MIRKVRPCLILMLMLAACAPAERGEPTPTDVPRLTAHSWSQSEPLIQMGYIPADAGCGFDPQLPADLTLLPDGRLYTLESPAADGRRQINSALLSRKESCKLLNSVDQAGFFDYDPATYIKNADQWTPPVLWAPTNTITVQAWRSNSVRLYWLDGFVDGQRNCPTCPPMQLPTILPAIRKTYRLLTTYEAPYSQIYQWDRLGVWIDTSAQNGDALEWPVREFPSSVPPVMGAAVEPGMILSGEEAAAVYDLFHRRIDTCGTTILHAGKYYRAFARPLLPNEYPSQPLPALALSCSPADGSTQVP